MEYYSSTKEVTSIFHNVNSEDMIPSEISQTQNTNIA
jgi:hypothetical protein